MVCIVLRSLVNVSSVLALTSIWTDTDTLPLLLHPLSVVCLSVLLTSFLNTKYILLVKYFTILPNEISGVLINTSLKLK